MISTIPQLSLQALLRDLGAVKIVEPMLEISFEMAEREAFVSQSGDAPHGRPWHVCLAGDTEVVTRQGIKPIRDLVGTVNLLVPEIGISRRGRFGEYQVRSYGDSPTLIVNLRRHKQIKQVVCTPNHRWYLDSGEVVTSDALDLGATLRPLAAQRSGKMKPVPFAFVQGFVYGDGTRRLDGRPAHLDIHHNGKDEAMLKFFANHETGHFTNINGMEITQIRSLPRLWKELPSFDESRAFLLSWLAGYFAADGCVDDRGYSSISSASRVSIEFARDVLAICGIRYGKIKSQMQSGTYPHGVPYTDREHFSIRISSYDLPSWFFLLDRHRDRALAAQESNKETKERLWKVDSIEIGEIQEVFCASVPDHGCFALADQLMTGNSFHASSFPGDSSQACGRLALYGLADIPSEGPTERWLASVADVGKAVELSNVRRVRDAGFLCGSNQPGRSTDPDMRDEDGNEYPQIGFIDEEHWLTASVDLPMLPLGHATPHIVEVKTKHESQIDEMQAGERQYDKKHRNQLLCSLTMAAEDGTAFTHPTTGEILAAPQDGTILYLSRDCKWPGPVKSHEFLFEPDFEFMDRGRAHLREWRQAFLDGILPAPVEFKNTRSHPYGWKWSEGACKYCRIKPICKKDYQSGTVALQDSHAIEHAKSLRPDYDYAAKRATVLEFWGIDDPLESP